MGYSDGGYSLADIAAATGRDGNNNGFADGNGWWVIIFLIFAFMGWGNRGFGNGFGGNNGSGVTDNYVLASDFATLQRQIDSSTATLERKADATQQGLCDGFYAMNTGMLNGFSGVQQALCQGFGSVNNAITQNGYETRLGINTIGSQLADCCCKTQSAIQGVNYNLATQSCDTRNTITTGFNSLMQANCINTRDIIDNQNANYRALHDEIVANRIEDKNAQITAQQNEINALRLAASQERQNNYLIDQLKPCPSPSYIVPNPNCCYNYGINGYGCNSGCGCN